MFDNDDAQFLMHVGIHVLSTHTADSFIDPGKSFKGVEETPKTLEI